MHFLSLCLVIERARRWRRCTHFISQPLLERTFIMHLTSFPAGDSKLSPLLLPPSPDLCTTLPHPHSPCPVHHLWHLRFAFASPFYFSALCKISILFVNRRRLHPRLSSASRFLNRSLNRNRRVALYAVCMQMLQPSSGYTEKKPDFVFHFLLNLYRNYTEIYEVFREVTKKDTTLSLLL